MRRGVKPKKKKPGSAALIAIVLNIIVWGGLGLLFEIHKLVVKHQADVSLITVKDAKFKPIKLPQAKAQPKTKDKSKPKSSATKKPGVKAKPGPPHPHFMATSPSANGSGHGSGPVVQAGGSGTAGSIPTGGGKKITTPAKANDQKTNVNETQPKVAPTPKKEPPPSPTIHNLPLHEVSSGPTASASPVQEIQPVIPDSLRNEPLNVSVIAQITINADGSSQVKLLNSSGNQQVDQIVRNTLEKWTWHPAQADGIPYSTTINYLVKIEVQ